MIYQILEQGKSSRDCLERVQRRHHPRDNAWIQEMSLGVMRKLPILQHWLRELLDRPLKGNKKSNRAPYSVGAIPVSIFSRKPACCSGRNR